MKLKKLDTIKRTITVHVPADGEGYSKEKMTAAFNILNQDEITALVEEGNDAATLDRIFVGFSGVRDEAGNDIEDTEENRLMLLKVPYIRQAILESYFMMAKGGDRRKN